MPTVIVLASGRGERFLASGGQVHKLQAPLAGRPVLQHTLAHVRDSGLPWHLEEAGHPGMGDSIAAAVRATPQAWGWLILPGDLPLVRGDTLRRVAVALGPGVDVAQARFQGRPGHPVGFSPAYGAALAGLAGAEGAATVLRRAKAAGRFAWVDVDDPGVVADIDTLADLAAAERMLSAS